jgi:hypothetical protein
VVVVVCVVIIIIILIIIINIIIIIVVVFVVCKIENLLLCRFPRNVLLSFSFHIGVLVSP